METKLKKAKLLLNQVKLIDQNDINTILEKAEDHPKSRLPILLNDSFDEIPQRFVNCLTKFTYVRPHNHIHTGNFEQILSVIPCAVFWKDKNGVFQGCNNMFLEFAGIKNKKDLIGKTDKELPWANLADKYYTDDQHVISLGERSNCVEQVTLSHKTITTSTIKVPWIQDGKTNGILGVIYDISEFTQAKEQAEKASKVKSEFILSMSHDVKTPLSGIISMAQILNFKAPFDCLEFSDKILKASQHLKTFFENCIELVKLEHDAIELLEENFDLRALLQEISELFEPTIKTRNLKMALECAKDVPSRLRGSRIALYRILLNLVSNAVKFTPEGSVTIHTSLSKKSTLEKAIIKITITDTGMGIPEDKQCMIFERFSRLHPSYEGNYEGNGIGLYVVQNFVRAMGGDVSLKSKETQGSQFTITLPFQIPAQIEGLYQTTITNPLTQLELTQPLNDPLLTLKLSHQQTPSYKPRILVVEDDVIAQYGVSFVLDTLECTVDIAENGKKALSLFKPGKYRLVFMDIGLPDIKGYDVAKEFRNTEHNTPFRVPILGLSAHATHEDRCLSTEVGIDKMLCKPLLLEDAVLWLNTYHVLTPLTDQTSAAVSDKLTSNSKLLRTEDGLKIIDLENYLGISSSPEEKTDWTLLNMMAESLPEAISEITTFYKTNNLLKLLDQVHKLHGAVCFTKTPHLRKVTQKLESCLKKENHEELSVRYQDFLEAVHFFEAVYYSILPKKDTT